MFELSMRETNIASELANQSLMCCVIEWEHKLKAQQIKKKLSKSSSWENAVASGKK